MYFGNFDSDYLFSTTSLREQKENGEYYFTKPVVNVEKLKLFEDFCKKENITKRYYEQMRDNEYQICEGNKLICGSQKVFDKLVEHLQKNVPTKRMKIFISE